MTLLCYIHRPSRARDGDIQAVADQLQAVTAPTQQLAAVTTPAQQPAAVTEPSAHADRLAGPVQPAVAGSRHPGGFNHSILARQIRGQQKCALILRSCMLIIKVRQALKA